MKKTLKITVFILISIFGLMPRTSSAERTNPFAPQLPEPVKVETAPVQETQTPRSTNLQVNEGGGVSNNRPTPQISIGQFIITGLIWNSNRPQAIVNDQVVDVGDKISEYQIVSISKTGIKLELNGQTFNVTP